VTAWVVLRPGQRLDEPGLVEHTRAALSPYKCPKRVFALDGLPRNALETTPADVERVMQVNFLAAVRITMAVLPEMVRASRGSVVNVTSVAGYIPNPKESAYGASKGWRGWGTKLTGGSQAYR